MITLIMRCRGFATIVLIAALTVGLAPTPGVRAAAPVAAMSAADLAQALQKKYDSISDFSADFIHTYQGGAFNKQLTERGHLLVKKPGKMRWEYSVPEEKLFVSDGVKMYSYIPQDKQVIVSTVPTGDAVTTPTLFLVGKGNLTKDFTSTIVDLPPPWSKSPPEAFALKLVPKVSQPDYDWLILVADPVSFQMRGLVTIDAQGGKSSFSFLNLKENVGLADKAFAFKIPRGVDVVSSSSGL
ncbi:MAG TPA: outer membrane lipoprotein chaperone LolA [Vicinamibacterales bacterium]|jgi:outer membrane lipoprotein carrier protein|nr:outer membrane lipoprotein chaperone LolA [Vicinamibacterales bacterium]